MRPVGGMPYYNGDAMTIYPDISSSFSFRQGEVERALELYRSVARGQQGQVVFWLANRAAGGRPSSRPWLMPAGMKSPVPL